jgi:hypothetical protein
MLAKKCIIALFALSALALSAAADTPPRFRVESLRTRHGFHWTVEHSRHYAYYFEAGTPAARNFENIKAVLEEDYSQIIELLGAKDPNFVTNAFIVDSRTRMKQLCGHESNGLSVGNVLLFVYGDSTNALGAHEETHILSQLLWGPPRETWLSEGLAVYSDDKWWGEPLNTVCSRLRSEGKLLPLNTLFDDRQFAGNSEAVTYPEAGSLVRFLYQHYGTDAVRAIWSRGTPEIPRELGKSIYQLEAEWIQSLAN